ncbi:MAG: hypothetical protein JWL61_4349 [Gemmatimonadetes bacterium]|nr:hypothetical protein [Gemmatimonadota bacterium]
MRRKRCGVRRVGRSEACGALRFVLRRRSGFESTCSTFSFTDGANQAEYQRSISHDEQQPLVYDSV